MTCRPNNDNGDHSFLVRRSHVTLLRFLFSVLCVRFARVVDSFLLVTVTFRYFQTLNKNHDHLLDVSLAFLRDSFVPVATSINTHPVTRSVVSLRGFSIVYVIINGYQINYHQTPPQNCLKIITFFVCFVESTERRHYRFGGGRDFTVPRFPPLLYTVVVSIV